MFVLKSTLREQQVLHKEDTMDGAPYIVFPMVMMVEGVHNGSGGPSFYSAEELSKHSEAWNLKPIVVRHPEDAGLPISACSKEIIEKQMVGVILNTVFEDGKLKAEAWINKQKAEKVFPGLISMLTMGSMMELSIGHFAEQKEESGVWNNEEYIQKITVIKPDHVALLPTEKGACSVEDGAGIPRINKEKEQTHSPVFDFRINKEKISFEEIRDLIYKGLLQKDDISVYVEAVYDDYFVYSEFDINAMEEVLWKSNYSVDASRNIDIGAPERVRRSVSYITANKETKIMEELLNLLKEKGLSPEGLEVLKSLKEEDAQTFDDLVTNLKAEILATMKESKEDEDEPEEENPDLTVNQFLEKVPERFREVLEDGVRLFEERKQKLIGDIVTNKQNAFSKKELEIMDIGALEKLQKLASKPDYTMQGGEAPIINSNVEPMEEVSLMKGDN